MTLHYAARIGVISATLNYITLGYTISNYTTNSTAQGGGGSFQIGNLWERLVAGNQKNGRANPRMDRQVVGASSYLFVLVSVHLCIG